MFFFFGSVSFNVVLIKVDTFTIFDTMESMKGQKNTRKPRRTIQSELQHHTFSYRFFFSFFFFVIALGGTSFNHRPRFRTDKP